MTMIQIHSRMLLFTLAISMLGCTESKKVDVSFVFYEFTGEQVDVYVNEEKSISTKFDFRANNTPEPDDVDGYSVIKRNISEKSKIRILSERIDKSYDFENLKQGDHLLITNKGAPYVVLSEEWPLID